MWLYERLAAYRQQRKIETGKLLTNARAILDLLVEATNGIDVDGPTTVEEFRAELADLNRRVGQFESRMCEAAEGER
jgi:hypothetical protein